MTKRAKILEIAELTRQHRNTVSKDVRAGALDLSSLLSIAHYIVQKGRDYAQQDQAKPQFSPKSGV